MKFQFDIFLLFVLTTVVALGCAIIVLPIPPIAKMCPISALAICYYGWLVRNHKYPDPRKPQPISRSSRILGNLLPMVIDIPIVIYALFARPWLPQLLWVWYSIAAYSVAITVLRLWLAFKPESRLQPLPSP